MIKFDKPKNLNGSQLLDELSEIGIVLHKIEQAPMIDENGDLWLDINKADAQKVAIIVENHDGIITPPILSPKDKLLAAGLTVDDLKQLLQLNV